MDDETLTAVVGAIPAGRWMSYADVCFAAGGVPARLWASTRASSAWPARVHTVC